jgi:hypothetical protein
MSLRMPVQLRSKVERWAKSQDDKPTLSKAICHLLERALDLAKIEVQIAANRAAHEANRAATKPRRTGKRGTGE